MTALKCRVAPLSEFFSVAIKCQELRQCCQMRLTATTIVIVINIYAAREIKKKMSNNIHTIKKK